MSLGVAALILTIRMNLVLGLHGQHSAPIQQEEVVDVLRSTVL